MDPVTTDFSEGSTEFFILASISFESAYWKEYFWEIKTLRQKINEPHNLKYINNTKAPGKCRKPL